MRGTQGANCRLQEAFMRRFCLALLGTVLIGGGVAQAETSSDYFDLVKQTKNIGWTPKNAAHTERHLAHQLQMGFLLLSQDGKRLAGDGGFEREAYFYSEKAALEANQHRYGGAFRVVRPIAAQQDAGYAILTKPNGEVTYHLSEQSAQYSRFFHGGVVRPPLVARPPQQDKSVAPHEQDRRAETGHWLPAAQRTNEQRLAGQIGSRTYNGPRAAGQAWGFGARGRGR